MIGKDKLKSVGIMLWVALTFFALGYIGFDMWGKLKSKVYQKGMQNGKNKTIQAILKKSQECKPFELGNGKKSVKLIGVKCLQQAQAQSKSTSSRSTSTQVERQSTQNARR